MQNKFSDIPSNNKILKTFRKRLRKNLTPAESKLWKYLQNKKLDGRKFRRQHSINNYILDFYCPSEKLAIELDGEVHNIEAQAEYDNVRDLFLFNCGIKVLRFENKVVFENPEYLINCIKKEFGKTVPLS
jgi:very-short-patch-repair endonuclease